MTAHIVQNGKLVAPFVIVCDTREQLPYAFCSLHADARQGGRPLAVRTETRGLEAGDYSLEGYERLIAVERKSLADLFGTVGRGRVRFLRELRALNTYDFAAVVVEGTWEDVLIRPPARSQLEPKTVYRSVLAWQQRYPRVHWWFCPGRGFAEVTTFRILERFWKDQQAKGRGKEPSY